MTNKNAGLETDIKHLNERLSYVSKQRDENELLQDHDRMKLVIDSQLFKDHCDELKLELHRANKRLDSLETID